MILVTGANGLLGSYLSKQLIDSGQKVRALRRKTSDLALLGDYAREIEWVEGDVLDTSSLEHAMQGVQQVYHSAALITFVPSEINYMMRVNIEGAANVVNAALHAGVQRFLHVSSISSFGRSAISKVIDENFGWQDGKENTWYSRSKQFGEREVWRAHAEGLDVVIACPSTILGAGNWNLPPLSIFKTVYERLPFYATGTNAFVDVRDCAAALITLMQNGNNGEKYIVSAQNMAFRELMNHIADEMKLPRPAYRITYPVTLAARAYDYVRSKATGGRPLLTKESLRMSQLHFQYNNQKITQLPGISFRPIAETVRDSVQVFMQNVAAGKTVGTF